MTRKNEISRTSKRWLGEAEREMILVPDNLRVQMLKRKPSRVQKKSQREMIRYAA